MSKQKINVLFVCMGNICRSPMAEGAFVAAVSAANLQNHFHIDSAGTTGYHTGNPPDARMQATAKTRGLDLSRQRSRKVRPRDFTDFDYIIAMDRDNYSDLMRQCPQHLQNRIHMFLPFAPELNVAEMPDPYYGGSDGFIYVCDAAIQAADALLSTIREERL